MARAIQVCTSTDCMSKGAKHVWKDLEDICSGTGCEVNGATCLNHCGKGPNVEIRMKGKEPKVIEKVDTFKAMEKILKSEVGVEMKKPERQLAEIKYELRRGKSAPDRMSKMQKAFQILGGEEKAGSTDARLASQLFVLRAKELLDSSATKALEDAQRATELWPKASEAFLVLGLAFEKLGKWNEALEAAEKAVELGDMKEGSGLVRRMRPKATDIGAEVKKEEGEAKKKEAAAAKKAEEEAKKKAEEAEEEEKKKSELAKKKREAAAKKKAEEAKRKAEEEERRKAEEKAAEAKRLEEEAKAREEAEAMARAEEEEAERERAARRAELEAKRLAAIQAARERVLEEEAAKKRAAEEAQQLARQKAAEARRLAYEASLQGRLRTCCGLPAIHTDDAE